MFKWILKWIFSLAELEEGRDYVVRDEEFYRNVVLRGSLGLGESYVRGEWSSPDLLSFFMRLCSSPHVRYIQQVWGWISPTEWWRWLTSYYFNPQTLIGSRKVGKEHYDLDPSMYEKMLSTPMMYSCAYWKDVTTLEQAQHQKIMLLARKLQLSADSTVLDIGCGWGDMAITLAKEIGCNVTGITISEQQLRIARQRAEDQGVGEKVKFVLEDYRQHKGVYDRVVSIGMLEHVGVNNLTEYFHCVRSFLRVGGLAVIHSITGRTNGLVGDPWIGKYIFPNSAIPSHQAWISSLRPVELEIEDVQNLGIDYARTLDAWRDNFINHCSQNLSRNSERLWVYYLTVCEAQFRIRGLQLFQMVLSRERVERYDAPR